MVIIPTSRAGLKLYLACGVAGVLFLAVWWLHDRVWLAMTLPCATIGGEELSRVAGEVTSLRHDVRRTGCRTQSLDRDQRQSVAVAIELAMPCSAAALGGEAFALEGGVGEVSERGGIYEIRMPLEDGCLAITVGDGSRTIAREDVAALARAVAGRREEASAYLRGLR